jgi:hypothetical protein
MDMTLVVGYWYEIVYVSGQTLTFQVIDGPNKAPRCRLCNGEETMDVLKYKYRYLIEKGQQSPC